jgi:hypothetical protein
MVGEFWLLGTLLLGWMDPSSLLRELTDDSIAVRERAAGALYRRGEDLRGFLVDARDAAADLEVRERLQGILRRLDVDERIRDFGGGNRVGGFGASLRSDRFFGSGPFRLHLDVMNLSAGDRELPSIASWEQDLPDQEFRLTGAQARVQVKKFIASPGLRRTSWRSGERVAESRLLRPGECARFEFVLDAKALPPGDYDVSIEYFARDLLPDAEMNLRTNTVRLMIRNR